ncbi:hypothetical protein [Staphylococcus epidermidis]|uniref:hypothetical protein n=1 Tax=Staphylococcus epidermidis TaxID=1282 RepID=UPI0016431052
MYLLTEGGVGEESERKEGVVKKGRFEGNGESGRMKVVYKEDVERVDVGMKGSDGMKGGDLVGG